MPATQIHFEAVVKNGFVKIPGGFPYLNNKKVLVDIFEKKKTSPSKKIRTKRVKNFLEKCSGILEHTEISPSISMKDISRMRSKERYGT